MVGLGKSSDSVKFLQKKSGPDFGQKSIFSMATHVGSPAISTGGGGEAPPAAENVSVLAHLGQLSCARHACSAPFWMTFRGHACFQCHGLSAWAVRPCDWHRHESSGGIQHDFHPSSGMLAANPRFWAGCPSLEARLWHLSKAWSMMLTDNVGANFLVHMPTRGSGAIRLAPGLLGHVARPVQKVEVDRPPCSRWI